MNELSLGSKKRAKPYSAWVVGIFLLSGFAGLVYEVVYAKALAITFGSSALAAYTVLATYMGGIAMGSWVGGHIAKGTSRPLWIYAVFEALIGVYAALTPQLFDFMQGLYVHFALNREPGNPWLTAVRFMLGVACLWLPTMLMGATTPLIFKYLKNAGLSSEKAIAPLYAANVLGAALGALVAGYFLLPALGRQGGTYIAAAISLLIALFAFSKIKKEKRDEPIDVILRENSPAVRVEKRKGGIALLILGLGGAVTLGLEVNAMHLLGIVAGNSVYAFALMLGTFLAALGLGSFVGQRVLKNISRIYLLGASQCLIAISVCVTAHLWDSLPAYFSSFSTYGIHLDFTARETIRAIVCLIAMFPPAFFIGLCYPIAMGLASDWISPNGDPTGMGLAGAINTLGNIAGVIAVGFLLLPYMGSRSTMFILAGISFILGTLAILSDGWNAHKISISFVKFSPAAVALFLMLIFPSQWDIKELTSGANVYFSPQYWGEVVEYTESVEGGLTSVSRNDKGVSVLLTNGKFQGNDSEGGEMLAQESFALFPLLHVRARDSALVIGYGTGMTAKVFHDQGVKQVDIAELSKDIVVMADKYFENINHGVLKKEGVSVFYADGRNYLLTQEKKYDVISVEITSIWFAGAANLYNKEFYELAAKRLKKDGVLQQWVQLHHISPIDLVYVIGSVRSVFENVRIYVRGGQGIIVASNGESFESYPGAQLVESAGGSSGQKAASLQENILLTTKGVDKMLAEIGHAISTDNNLYLEYSTPKGNALGDVVQSNLNFLRAYER